ncbi:glucose-6-phosphate dehydrogenase [Bacillus thuringiensis]|nr:glucose-6-phosphate dehydrogenase [Bacillus thuringiensis]
MWATKELNRLIMEKPFSHNFKSTCELNAKLSKPFDEADIYCIDHYL